MATSPIGSSLAGLGTPATSSSAGSSSGLSQTDFLKLLTAQMQYQDPLNPVSNSDFVTQLTQFSSLQGMQQVNTTLASMLLVQQLSQGANLIGKQVSYDATGKGLITSGLVNSVQVQNGQLQLMIGGNAVTMSQVRGIQQQSNLAANAAGSLPAQQ